MAFQIALEVAIGLLMIASTALLLPLAALISGPKRAIRMDREVVGKFGHRFRIYRLGFPEKPILRSLNGLPIGLNLVRGEMALVGPRPLETTEVRYVPPIAFRRFDVRPGIASLFALRKQANVAFDGEFAIDAEYIEKASLGHDTALLARYVSTAWMGKEEPTEAPPKVTILGIEIENLTMAEATDWIVREAETRRGKTGQGRRVCFVNADCGNLTFKNRTYFESLGRSDMVLADGIGMRLAGKMLKQPIIENVNGTDMFPRLCERLGESETSIYLLGGKPGIAQGVAEWVTANYPGTRIAGFRDGYFKPEEEPAVIEEIRRSDAGLLLVAFGAPRQDLWIEQHLPSLGVSLAVGVGGLFDFYSQRIPRAPQWMRELGLEWLFRLIQEPGRLWKRYVIGNVMFLTRVIRYREGHPTKL